MKARGELFHVGLGAFVATPSIPLFLYPRICHFRILRWESSNGCRIAGNHDHVQREATACFSCSFPVLFARGIASHTILFHPRRLFLSLSSERPPPLQAWKFKGTTSPATSMWMWQIKGREDSAKMVQCGKTTLIKVPINVIFWSHTDGRCIKILKNLHKDFM